MMKKMFWYKGCPLCNQGRLFIFKNIDSAKLYLHCEECERGYYNPFDVNVENSFPTLEEDFQAVQATLDDLVKFHWDKLKINTICDD